MNFLPTEVLELRWWLQRDDVICKNRGGNIVAKDDETGVFFYLKTCQSCGAALKKCSCGKRSEVLTLVWDDTTDEGNELQTDAVLAVQAKSSESTPAQVVSAFKERALLVVSRGIPVTPLKENDKQAFLPEWQKSATTDLEQIETWAREYPTANCGAVAQAKPGGFLFFEVDSPDVLKRIQDETGQTIPANFTMTVGSSPGRGHIYLNQTAASIAAGNISQAHVKHGDWSLRVDNGYVVGPKSVHPKTGKTYEIKSEAEIADAPEWLIAWCVGQKVKNSPPVTESQKNERGPIPHGQIHGYMLTLAGRMRYDGLTPDEIEPILLRKVLAECVPPIDQEKVKAMARSMANYGEGDPGKEVLHLGSVTIAEQNTPSMPDPLHEDAYYGIAGRHLRQIAQNSEAHPAGILGLFLAAFGSIVGMNAYVRVEDNIHYPILNVLVTGRSSRSRKDTAMGRALRPLREADRAWALENVHQSFSSGEAVVSYFDRLSRKGVPLRLFVTDTEFKTTLNICGREGNTLSETYRHLFNGDPLEVQVKKQKDILYVPASCGSIGGLITLGELLETLKAVEIESGFANRFMTMLVHRVKKISRPVRITDKTVIAERHAIVAAIKDVLHWIEKRKDDFDDEDGTKGLRLSWDEEAGRMWDTFYYGLADDDPDYLNRAEVFVMRLSMIYALLDQSRSMGLEHLKAALAVWRYAEQSGRFVYGSPQSPDVTRLLTKALSTNGLKRGGVSNFFGRHKNTEELDWVMEETAKVSNGRLEAVYGTDKAGRPTVAGLKTVKNE